MSLKDHKKGVTSILFTDKYMISGGLDKLIKIWEIKNQELNPIKFS